MATFHSARLSDLAERFLEERDEAGFWRAAQRMSDAGAYPIVEALSASQQAPEDYVSVTFLHRRARERPKNVLLLANINHVVPEELLFEPIGDTDVYFKTVAVPAGVRFEYRIIEDDPLTGLFAAAKYGTRLHLLGGDPDPLNPKKRTSPDLLGKGQDYVRTWVELPGASPQPYLVARGSDAGDVTSEVRQSDLLGYTHRVFTYLPPKHDAIREYPLMILFDSGDYFSGGSLQLTLDNLIAEGSIPPRIVLGLNPGRREGETQRNDELTCNPRFAEFIEGELLPWFTVRHRVSPDPARRVIAGSSYGGLFAMYFAFDHPNIVSNVLSQSGSFHWGRAEDEVPFEWLVREFAFAERRPLRIFMEVGTLEGEYSWDNPGFPHQIVSYRHFKTILDLKGYDVTYREYRGGHEMLSWRGGIAEGLRALLGTTGSV